MLETNPVTQLKGTQTNPKMYHNEEAKIESTREQEVRFMKQQATDPRDDLSRYVNLMSIPANSGWLSAVSVPDAQLDCKKHRNVAYVRTPCTRMQLVPATKKQTFKKQRLRIWR